MDNYRGMAWMTLAMLSFAVEDALIKLTLGAVPVGQVIAFLGLGGGAMFALLAAAQGERIADPALFSRPFVIRMLAEVVGTVCFVTALATIDLSLLTAIIQANPLLVTVGAAVFLAQPVGWRRWLAIGVGLVGVLIIVRPGLAGFEPASLWAVGATLGLVGRDLATRVIPSTVSTALLAGWGFFAAGIAGLVLLAAEGGAVLPDADLGLTLLAALLCGMVAYYSITAAMRVGEIAAVTPFRYTRLVFAMVLAAVFFDERPDMWTLIGAGIVIATGLYTLFRERRVMRG